MTKPLHELLKIMSDNDNTENVLNEEDFSKLVGDIRDKVDSIKDYFSRSEAEIARLQNDYIKPIQARIKAINVQNDNLKKWIISTMKFHDLPVLNGDLHSIRLTDMTKLDIDDIEITNMMYINYQDICIRKYDFDKKEIKKRLEEGKQFEFARLKKEPYIKWSIKKGNSK